MIKAPLKLSLVILWILLCIPPIWLLQQIRKTGLRDRMVRACYRGILRIMGIRLHVHGEMSDARPLMLVTNHISYLDVCILGSQLAVRFTPKSEINGWPMIGFICRICDSVFIDRRPEKIQEMADKVSATLASGAVVSIFPEATTGSGIHLLPFKPGFFHLAEQGINGQELAVQPAAITYTRIRRLPIDSTQWPQVAWYGDMDLAPHMLALMKLGPIDVELTYLPPLTITECQNRKRMAEMAQTAIARAIEDARARRFALDHSIKKPWMALLLKRQGMGK